MMRHHQYQLQQQQQQLHPPMQYHAPLQKSASLQSSVKSFPDSLMDCHNYNHNLSQDSGISPSPAMLSQLSQSSQSGIYDNYNHHLHHRVPAHIIPVETPQRRLEKRSSGGSGSSRNGRWRLGSFFKRKSAKSQSDDNSDGDDDQHFRQLVVKTALPPSSPPPPPLPPRASSQLPPQQQQLPGSNVFQPTMHVRRPQQQQQQQQPSWTTTIPDNSPFANYDVCHNRRSLGFEISPQRQQNWRREQKETLKQRVEAKRNSVRDSSSDNNEDDSSSQTSSSFARRHKHRSWRRSRCDDSGFHQMVGEDVLIAPPPPPPRNPTRRLHLLKNENGRPVSYSFENIVPDLGLPVTDSSGRVLMQPSPYYNGLQHLSASEQRLISSHSDVVNETPRSRRPVHLTHSLPPNNHLVMRNPPMPNPPAEYWKSPPPQPPAPPILVIPYHSREKARLVMSEDDGSPQRPLRKKPSSNSRDSVISTQNSSTSIEKSGKSSPSSVSSKDSGCCQIAPVAEAGNPRLSRPLSALLEKSESQDKEATPEPKSKDDDPGFSTRIRRSRFRAALSELEDVLSDIQKDTDLLDRAERRDLPTAHQELRLKQFQGNSEENSRIDDDDGGFSDLDNFMNWNTSSSFENVAAVSVRQRQRTPSNRRSGVVDKEKDDMAYRAAAANNRIKPETTLNHIDHSYLQHSPALSPAPPPPQTSRMPKSLVFEEEEPDVITDDLGYRLHRDANANSILDPQPLFGIPKEISLPGGCSDSDYLHAVPDSFRYRSTFNAMRNPDLVQDDLAFRSLRRDSNLAADPSLLGVIRDPNVVANTCWRHKMEERDNAEQIGGPYVFYPARHNAVMKSLSEHIARIIKKQSGAPGGGMDEQIVTYQDLKDPKVYEAMKYALNIIEQEGKEQEQWEGKNVYELLSTNVAELLERKKSKKSSFVTEAATEARDGDTVNQVLVVQHCILEHDLDAFNKTLSRHLQMKQPKEDLKKMETGGNMTESMENSRDCEKEKERTRSEGGEEDEELTEEASCNKLILRRAAPGGDGDLAPLPPSSRDDKGEMSCCSTGGVTATTLWLDHPLLLLACYLLACLHQFSGLDFLTVLGVLCAAVSVISIFFI